MHCFASRKSILTSTTFWSVVLLLFQAVGPSIDKVIARGGQFTSADVWAIVQACVTALVGVIARYNVGDLYTPRGVPGIDPPRKHHSSPSDVSISDETLYLGEVTDVSARDRTRTFKRIDGTQRH